MSVRIEGNPFREKKDVKEKILSLKDAQLIDYVRSLESRKDLRADNSLSLMVLGEGESGGKTLISDICEFRLTLLLF